LGCVGFDPNDPRREPWNGRWPGEEDAERLGFFIGGDRSLPDINRLFAKCHWNAEAQRWEHDPAQGALIRLPSLIAVCEQRKRRQAALTHLGPSFSRYSYKAPSDRGMPWPLGGPTMRQA